MKSYRLFLFIFLFCLGLMINVVPPITPIYFDIKQIPINFFGYFFATFAIASALFGLLPVLRKQINYLPLIGILAVSQLLLALNAHLLIIILLRLLAGAIAGILIVDANTQINLLARKRKRLVIDIAIAIGMYGLGNSCGYLLGGYFGAANWLIPLFIQLTIGLTLTPIALIFSKVEVDDSKQKGTNNLKYASLLNALTLLSFAVIVTAIPFIITIKLDYSVIIVGWFMFTYGIISLIINLVINPLIKKHTEPKLAFLSALLLAIITLSLSFLVFDNSLLLLIIILLFMVVVTFIRPILNAFIVLSSTNDQSGLAIANASMYVGSFAGSLLSAFTYHIHLRLTFLTSLIVIIMIAVIAIFIPFAKNVK